MIRTICSLEPQSGEQFWKLPECYVRGSTVSVVRRWIFSRIALKTSIGTSPDYRLSPSLSSLNPFRSNTAASRTMSSIKYAKQKRKLDNNGKAAAACLGV